MTQKGTIHVRRAIPSDAPQMAAMHIKSWNEIYRCMNVYSDAQIDAVNARRLENYTKNLHDEQGDLTLVRVVAISVEEGEEKVVGLAMLGESVAFTLDTYPDFPLQIKSLYVDSSYFGLGVAQQMLGEGVRLLGWTKSSGKVICEALEANERAIAFYKKVGGEVVGREVTGKYGLGEVAVVAMGWESVPFCGNYYSYDNPAALNRQLMEHFGRDYDTWQYELNLLYVVYSFPNMFLPYFGGLLVDRLGMRILILYASCGFIGQLMFAAGIHAKNISVSLVGRFLFGVGGESLVVIQGCLMAGIFEGEELAFALGLNLCVSRLGSVANAILSPILDKHFGVEAAVGGGTLACFASFLSALTLFVILPTNTSNTRVQSVAVAVGAEPMPVLVAFEEEEECPGRLSINILPYLPRRDHESESEPETASLSRRHRRRSTHSILSPNESTPLLFLPSEPPLQYGFCTAFSQFPSSFWILCLMYVVFYGSAWTFNNTASDFLQDKWYPNDTITAGFVMSIPDSTSSILVVLCGYFLDSNKWGATLLVLSFMTITVVHFLLGFTAVDPVPSLIALGVAYSINPVVIWPSVAIVIQRQERKLASLVSPTNEDCHDRESILGAAYGVCTAALNMALTVIPMLAAWIRVDGGGGWVGLEMFYGGLAGIGFCGACVLYAGDGLREGGRGDVGFVDEEVVF
ncbi:hypothetical protein HDU98_005561 [Podochytrium sp. JEL0797]|nr:hypothetical protein HDU98_005561 [Podochytrium sp. JEL0797]